MSNSAANVIRNTSRPADPHVDRSADFDSPIEAEFDDSSPQRLSDDVAGSDATGVNLNADASLAELQPDGTSAAGDGAQKRRRVTRACDECRKKKIKCDGKQPCNHCVVYGYDCTYDQPSHRRRNAAPHVVEQLERRLQRAEALLRVFLPAGKDPSDPSLDALIEGHLPASQPLQSDAISLNSGSAPPQPDVQSAADPSLESMVRATANLDLDEHGSWEYKGHSSGLSFIRSLRAQLGDFFGEDDPDGLKMFASPARLSETRARASPEGFRPSVDSPFDTSVQEVEELPSRERALDLCHGAIEDAGAIILIVHKPTFSVSFERIYSKSSADYDVEDRLFLPLLYSVLAVGCLFLREPPDGPNKQGYEPLMAQGYKYFWAARRLVDVVDCREMVSLQALVFMTYFLQCSAKLSICYTFVGLALRTAMRMGLHRVSQGQFSPIESETRKRVFWVIRKFDVYVGTIIGLPQALTEDEIDQVFPTEVNDQYITDDGILPMPPGEICTMAAANANFRMTEILRKVVKHIYPIKGMQESDDGLPPRYRVSVSKIHEIETDLQNWLDDLPPAFKPVGECPDGIYRIRSLLRMSYALAQLMLYRPFLHYVSKRHPKQTTDHRSYACAAASVTIARNSIHITADMKKRGLLVGSYWFTMYTTFFAILTLVYYVLENLDDAAALDMWKDALEGGEALAALSQRSMAADRCTKVLTRLFQYASKVINESKVQIKNSAQRRKRQSTAQDVSVKAESFPSPSDSMRRESAFSQSSSRKGREIHLAPKPVTAGAGHSVHSTLSSQSHTPNSQDATSFTSFASTVDPSLGNAGQPPLNAFAYRSPMQDHTVYGSQYGNSDLYGGKLNDMSSMIFPSPDPFAYPKQPMLTLEHELMRSNQQCGQQMMEVWDPAQYPPSNQQMESDFAGAMPGALDDHLDVHMLGPLPDFLAGSQDQAHGGSGQPPHLQHGQMYGMAGGGAMNGAPMQRGVGHDMDQRATLGFQAFHNVWPHHGTATAPGPGRNVYGGDGSWRQG